MLPPASVPPLSDPLARLLEQVDLCLVDVGARGNPPEPARRIARFVRLVAFEPDAAEAESLRGRLREWPWREAVVVAAAIGEPPSATLHVTAHAGFSSLLPPDQAVAARYQKTDAALRVTRTQLVPTIGLDAAADRYGFQDACWLKLDVQGGELIVLRTGESLLRSLVAVQTEAALQPLYMGQPMLGDIDAYFRSHGFLLADLRIRSIRGAGFDKQLYSRRQPLSADCLYLRTPDALARPADPRLSLGRYVAIALAYDHHDLVLDALGRSRSGDLLATLRPAALDYARARTALKLAGLPPGEARRLRKASEKRP